MCIITQNFVVIGQAAGQIWQFMDFLQNGSCLPSCLMHTRITHKEYLVVFMVVQNLVEVVSVGSIT